MGYEEQGAGLCKESMLQEHPDEAKLPFFWDGAASAIGGGLANEFGFDSKDFWTTELSPEDVIHLLNEDSDSDIQKSSKSLDCQILNEDSDSDKTSDALVEEGVAVLSHACTRNASLDGTSWSTSPTTKP